MKKFIGMMYKRLLGCLLAYLVLLVICKLVSNLVFVYGIFIGGLVFLTIFLIFKKSMYAFDGDLKAFDLSMDTLKDEVSLEKGVFASSEVLGTYGFVNFKGVYKIDVESVSEEGNYYLVKKYTNGVLKIKKHELAKSFLQDKLA